MNQKIGEINAKKGNDEAEERKGKPN